MLSALLAWRGAAEALRSVCVLTVGTAIVSRSLREQTLRTFGRAPHVTYGTNETDLLAAAAGLMATAHPESIGYPIPGGEFEIVDHDEPITRPDLIGEIRVRYDGMISAYYDDAELTRRTLRNGWFHPGDLACWSRQGYVIFKGRADDLMILDGIKIYPAEIEFCLQSHPAVREAIAFPMPLGERGDLPVAAVRVCSDVAESGLVGYARERLGVRHPRRILIVEDFPRNAAGKPLKREMIAALKSRDF
jgi:acyl-coenzyme A synthetase/AMP-(fatty) acid ligase